MYAYIPANALTLRYNARSDHALFRRTQKSCFGAQKRSNPREALILLAFKRFLPLYLFTLYSMKANYLTRLESLSQNAPFSLDKFALTLVKPPFPTLSRNLSTILVESVVL